MNKKLLIIFLFLAVSLTAFLFYNYSSDPKIEAVVIPEIVNQAKPVEIMATSTKPDIVLAPEPVEAPMATVKATSVPIVSNNKFIKMVVPFTPQAPFGEWSDLRQENACEEAAAVMALRWVRNESLSPLEAKTEILAISDWEQKKYGTYQDTSASDTVDRIFKDYFNYDQAAVVTNIELPDIIHELEKGNLVIVPANGQALGNPFFTAPGPEEHMLVIIGYNYQSQKFIVNESGTKRGRDYEYDEDILFEAIRDYPTGNKKPIIGTQKNMIVVQK